MAVLAALAGYGLGRAQSALALNSAESAEMQQLETRNQEALQNVEERMIRAEAFRDVALASASLAKGDGDAAQKYLNRSTEALKQSQDSSNRELATKVESLANSGDVSKHRQDIDNIVTQLDAMVPVPQIPGRGR